MINRKKLREEQARLRIEAEEIFELLATEGREMTEEEEATIDAAEKEIARIEGILARADRMGIMDVTDETANRVRSQPQNTVIVPVSSRGGRKLKAFKDEATAYKAGRFFAAVLFNHDPSRQWCQEHGIDIRAAMAGGTANAGVLTPVELEASVINLVEEYGVMRKYARKHPMGSDTLTVPTVVGGVTVMWYGQNEPIEESDMTFGDITLVAKKLAALTRYSNEISDDALVNVGDLIADDMARAISVAEDTAGFLGGGEVENGGLTGVIPSVINFTGGADVGSHVVTDAASPGGLTIDDFTKAMARLRHYAGIRPAWYVHSSVYYSSMLNIAAKAGGNTIGTLEAGSSQPMFLGYPVRFTQVLSDSLEATTGVDEVEPRIIFGDLSMGVAFGDRRGLQVRQSEHYAFNTDSIVIRSTIRLDIQMAAVNAGDTTNPLAGAMVVMSTATAT